MPAFITGITVSYGHCESETCGVTECASQPRGVSADQAACALAMLSVRAAAHLLGEALLAAGCHGVKARYEVDVALAVSCSQWIFDAAVVKLAARVRCIARLLPCAARAGRKRRAQLPATRGGSGAPGQPVLPTPQYRPYDSDMLSQLLSRHVVEQPLENCGWNAWWSSGTRHCS